MKPDLMGQSVYNLCSSLCDFPLGHNDYRNWAGEKAQQAGPQVTKVRFLTASRNSFYKIQGVTFLRIQNENSHTQTYTHIHQIFTM